MSDSTPHPHGRLILWLQTNVIAMMGLAVIIIGATGGAIWATSKWINTFENQISLNQSGLLGATHDVTILQGNVVSLDARVNELNARVIELHTESDRADEAIKKRLDIKDALDKFIADRALQPNLPAPTQQPQGPRR
jgi:peptidoglycan hydrolase CwlO-like protein